MAPGPPNLGTNRFALLADSTTIKKNKKSKDKKNKSLTTNLQDLFPGLPSVKKPNPKFVVLEATDKNKPLSHYSCFAVDKSIRAVSREIQSISELRDGNILLLVNNKSVAERFLGLKELPGICNIKAKYHENLNFNKGTVFAPFLNNVNESEIVSELSAQGVVAAYKFQKKITNDKLVPSGVVLLTFDLFHLPDKIDIAWRNVRIRQYIPNPMRCKNCQLLGHTAKFCKRSPACVNCNFPPHQPDNCTRILCANCLADHPSSSNKCPKFIQAKDIQKIKTTNKCTMREAIKIYQSSTPSLPENALSFSTVLSMENCQPNIPEITPSNPHPQITQHQLYNNAEKTLPASDLTLNNITTPFIAPAFTHSTEDLPINISSLSNFAQTQETSIINFANTDSHSSLIHSPNFTTTDFSSTSNFSSDHIQTNNTNLPTVKTKYSFLPLADDTTMSSEDD